MIKEAKLMSGIPVRDDVVKRLSRFVAQRKAKKLSIPHLTIIQVDELPESSAYIRQKELFGEKIGAEVEHIQLKKETTEKELVSLIGKLNKNKKVHGVIVQLPLPKHISKDIVLGLIDPKKDVDGLTPINVKRLMSDDKEGITPATARGVLTLCRAYKINPKGKHVVVVGRSALVGGPIIQTFLNAGATVTVCHILTKPLYKYTAAADILIVAAGAPKLISKKHVSKGQIVVDVGITVVNKKGKRILVGDVDAENIKDIVAAYSPVPGGVGPLTVASLFENLCEVVE